MMRSMMSWYCGPDGRPNFDKMTKHITHQDRARKYDAAGCGLEPATGGDNTHAETNGRFGSVAVIVAQAMRMAASGQKRTLKIDRYESQNEEHTSCVSEPTSCL